ncbi:MAG: hypothetical protein H8E08_00360 [Candidatus Marinimicrobia bacterium]|nr:hypothetical protein [Candidatus Neomarinimicrobiota bacterium]
MKISGYMGIIGSIQFIIIPIIAMFYYGGGTAWNPGAEGYTFWQNFLSDLGRTFAYNGIENKVSSPLFNVSLGLFGTSLVLLHSSAYRLFSSNLGFLITPTGMISGFGMIIIASAPDNLLPDRHMLGVWIWALSLLVVSIFIIIHDVSSKEGKQPFVMLSIIMALAVAYHISQGIVDVRGPLVAATQKVVVYLNCGWYLCLSRRILDYSKII